MTVPPTYRAPRIVALGPAAAKQLEIAQQSYNSQLLAEVESFKANHTDLDRVTVFDTRPFFNALLDNASHLGYVNITGYCEAYSGGTTGEDAQILPCLPVSSYL